MCSFTARLRSSAPNRASHPEDRGRGGAKGGQTHTGHVRGCADRVVRSSVNLAVGELVSEQEGDREGKPGEPTADASVGVAAKLAEVGQPRVGTLESLHGEGQRFLSWWP